MLFKFETDKIHEDNESTCMITSKPMEDNMKKIKKCNLVIWHICHLNMQNGFRHDDHQNKWILFEIMTKANWIYSFV